MKYKETVFPKPYIEEGIQCDKCGVKVTFSNLLFDAPWAHYKNEDYCPVCIRKFKLKYKDLKWVK